MPRITIPLESLASKCQESPFKEGFFLVKHSKKNRQYSLILSLEIYAFLKRNIERNASPVGLSHNKICILWQIGNCRWHMCVKVNFPSLMCYHYYAYVLRRSIKWRRNPSQKSQEGRKNTTLTWILNAI